VIALHYLNRRAIMKSIEKYCTGQTTLREFVFKVVMQYRDIERTKEHLKLAVRPQLLKHAIKIVDEIADEMGIAIK
jgi:hypothetical protein